MEESYVFKKILTNSFSRIYTYKAVINKIFFRKGDKLLSIAKEPSLSFGRNTNTKRKPNNYALATIMLRYDCDKSQIEEKIQIFIFYPIKNSSFLKKN